MKLFRESGGSTITTMREGERFEDLLSRAQTNWKRNGGGKRYREGKATGNACCSVGPYIFDAYTMQDKIKALFKNSDIMADDWLEKFMETQYEIDERFDISSEPYENDNKEIVLILFENARRMLRRRI